MPNPSQYRRVSESPLDGGIRDSVASHQLQPGQSPDCENVDFDSEAIDAVRGATKFGNRPAPRAAILTRVDPGLSPLSHAANKSVPMRGWIMYPYAQDIDRGGDFAANGAFPTQTFHARRQRLSEVTQTISFHVPKEERLFSTDTKGGGAPTTPATGFSNTYYDEAIDEIFILKQKGGDRLAPMSWFIGVVNVGAAFEALTGAATTPRVSNWAICFGCLDAPEYGQQSPTSMRYKTGTGSQANVGTTGSYCTMAYRVIVFALFVEPGKDYHLAIAHKLDTGSAGSGANPTATWNGDGKLSAALVDSSYSNPTIPPVTYIASVAAGTAYVWKGPTDTLDYFLRYGVRYSSRDACFSGMGLRNIPHRSLGNIPYGFDAAPLEAHGHKMVDRSRLTSTTLATPNALTSTHAAVGDAFVDVNAEKLYYSGGTMAHGFSPFVGSDLAWIGLGIAPGGTTYNPEALRGYRFVLDGGAGATLRGAWVTIGSYSEPGGGAGPWRFSVLTPTPNFATWGATPTLIQCLRWSARPVRLNEVRIYNVFRDYTETANVAGLLRMFDLSGQAQLDDEVHKDLRNLIACWPMDEGEGGVLREIVAGRDAWIGPYATPVSKNGTIKNRLFLSGEGEALCLDLSKDPVFEREFTNMLRSGSGGFAIELTAVFPEAIYDHVQNTATETQGIYGPTILEWAARGNETSGLSDPKPLLRLSFRTRVALGAGSAELRPAGFTLEVAQQSDQLDPGMALAVSPWSGGAARFSTDATWVGKPVTIQIGVHPSQFTPGSFDVYLAMTPKDLFLSADGDPAGAEWAYYSTMTMDAKDLVRSMIVFGGQWRPGTLGQSALNCRMMIDKAMVYVAAAPGSLPSASGGIVTARDGKLSGGNALPQRELSSSDLLLPVGDGVTSVNVNEASGTVTPAGGTAFYGGDPEDSLKALRNTFLLVANDKHEVRNEETLPREINDFYFVKSVTSSGSSATLQTPYSDSSRTAATAHVLRVGGYTVFADDQFGRGVTLGQGRPFVPGTSTIDNATLVDNIFFNLAPLGANFGYRIYSSLSSASAFDIIPAWVRGVVTPRRNPIRGLWGNEEALFCGAGPCLTIVDDRWRPNGPRERATASLAFRGKRSPGSQIVWPEVYEGLYYTSASLAQITASILTLAGQDNGYWIDFWVCPKSVDGFQTISWYGDIRDNPELLPGEASGTFRFNHLVRLNSGRPEFAIGSTDTITAGSRPEKGLFTATGDVVLKPGEFTHIRWHVSKAAGVSFLSVPTLFVNGRRVTVSVNARATGAGTNWVSTGGIVDSAFPEPRLVLGVARDSFLEPTSSTAVTENVINGPQLRPARYAGWMHALDGQLCCFRMGTATTAELSALASFNPEVFLTSTEANTWETSTVGAGSSWKVFIGLGEGIGHRPIANLRDSTNTPSTEYGVITSHPFVELWCEMGSEDEPFSFATYGSRVFATKGGRVVQHDQRRSITRWAGLIAPTNAPSFEIERKPLWKVSSRTTGSPDNPPFTVSAADVQDRNSYYSTVGNNYLEQAFHEEMRWERDDAAAASQRNDVFAFKCLVRPTETAGRIPLYYQRDSLASGGIFLEIRDGRMVLGWYDTFLKQEQTIETDVPVFSIGSWHYIYVRKKWPKTSAGNWEDSLYRENMATQVQKDELIVRVFPRFDTIGDGTGVPIRETNWDAKADHAGAALYPNNTANCISFTTLASSDVDATFTALGRVTPTSGIGALPPRVDTASTGGNNGTLTRNAGGFASPFHPDMVGMLVHWKQGTTARLGRITSWTSANVVAVTTIDGLGAVAANANVAFCVCTGVKLVKSANFATSNRPDSAPYDIRVFGSPMAGQALTGVQRFRGDFGSFAYTSFREDDTLAFSVANSPAAFHDSYKGAAAHAGGVADPVEQGTDTFSGHIWAATAPGELAFTAGGRNFTIVQSSQPNEDREVTVDTTLSSINAQSLFWRDLVEVNALAGTRRVFVTFYDPVFNDESNPGPALTILPALEDQANPSGDAAILLEDLPVSRDGAGILRRVYMTNVDGATPHLVAELDATASSVAIFKSEAQIAREQFLDFFNAQPPRCKYIAVSQKVVVYAGLRDQPDGLRYSEPFAPTVVPLVNLITLPGGRNSAITGVADLQGRLVVFKGLNAIWSILLATGASSTKLLSTNHGCTAHNTIQSLDDRLYWHDPRGIMMFNGTSTPEYVSDPLSGFFKEQVDPRFFKYQAATINRERNQYVLATKEAASLYPQVRVAVEFDHPTAGTEVNRQPARHRFSRYRHPNVTALSNVADRPGGQQRVVCGTEQGFVMWMDRSETNLIGMGPAGGYGSAGPILVTSGVQTYAVPFAVALPPFPVAETGAFDTELSGPRDVVMRWRVGGVEKSAVALGLHQFAGGVWLMMDRNIPAADLPTDGSIISLGDALPYWESRWMPFDLPEQGRRAYWLNIFHKREDSGTFWVTVYKDFDEDNPVVAASEFNLDNPLEKIPLPFHFQWLKVRIERKTPLTATVPTQSQTALDFGFTISDIVVRIQEQERN